MSIILSILRLLLAFAVLVLAGGVEAGEPPRVPVAIELYFNGRLLGTPVVTLGWDRPASIRVDRPGGYAITLTLRHARVGGAPVAELASDVQVEDGGRWTRIETPALQVDCSGEGSLFIDGRADAVRPLRLTARIDPAAIDPSCTKR